MREIPFWHRLGTRLTLLILGVVAVLTLATAILIVRGFDLVVQDAVQAARSTEAGANVEVEVGGVLRATLINLAAVFLFTLVGATVFSRTLLTEPIVQLVRGTRQVAAGRLGTTLPVTSRSELGRLAEDFNAMSQALAESREHLEQRVQERTEELHALLAISNATALTLELSPLLEVLLERLTSAVPARGAAVYELVPGGSLRRLASRGDAPAEAVAARAASHEAEVHEDGVWAIPLRVRGSVAGVLAVVPSGALSEPRSVLARAFANQAAVALENAQLYERVQQRAAVDERQHLARELHDSVSQALYAILLGTHAAQRHLPGGTEKTRDALEYVENLAQAALAEMRALIFELRPAALEDEGLLGVLRRQSEVLERRHGLHAELVADAEPDLATEVKTTLFRVAQEAVHNVVKHARATSVRIVLAPPGKTDEARWTLEVHDDGAGFETAAATSADVPGHLGLTSMRERLEAVGGTLRIASSPGEGTTVRARVPAHPAATPGGGDEGGEDTP
ncbi:MAG: histidine kinase [Trueperaceae bacterium]|nr:histidine kinase [Trueperaceae bacterium]